VKVCCLLPIACVFAASLIALSQSAPVTQNSEQGLIGTLRSMNGSNLAIETREGRTVTVDAKTAIESHHAVPLVVGRAFYVRGRYDAKGVLHAETILQAKESSVGRSFKP
jgi:hypothetical protein